MSTAPTRLGGRNPRVLAQSMALDEEGAPTMTRKAWMASTLGACAMLVWAGLISIDDLATTKGRVIPGGDAKTVHHQDGGIVSEILVSDGDIVEQGQPLIRLDDKVIKDKIRQMEVSRAKKAMLAAQLKALGQGGDPDFSFAMPRFKDIVNNELMIFAELKQLSEKRRRVLSGRVKATKVKLNNIIAQERTLSKDAGFLKKS